MALKGEDLCRLGPAAQRQILAKLGQKQMPKENKYKAKKTEVNGITFDSKKEAAEFERLLKELDEGHIRDLRLQQEFLLQPAYTTPEGERVRSIKYVADFVYEALHLVKPASEYSLIPDHCNFVWRQVVEDVKSPATRKDAVYCMKKKMMQERFGITIREV